MSKSAIILKCTAKNHDEAYNFIYLTGESEQIFNQATNIARILNTESPKYTRIEINMLQNHTNKTVQEVIREMTTIAEEIA